LEQLTSTQLSEWEAYDRLDPIGETRDDLRTARLMSQIANIVATLYCEEGKEPKLRTPNDFMPVWRKEDVKKEEPEKQSWQEIKQAFAAFTKRHNAAIDRKNRNNQKPPKIRRR